MDIQRNLEANVEKRTKDTYGPPMGKRLLVFMDDMNMPKVALGWGAGSSGQDCVLKFVLLCTGMESMSVRTHLCSTAPLQGAGSGETA